MGNYTRMTIVRMTGYNRPRVSMTWYWSYEAWKKLFPKECL